MIAKDLSSIDFISLSFAPLLEVGSLVRFDVETSWLLLKRFCFFSDSVFVFYRKDSFFIVISLSNVAFDIKSNSSVNMIRRSCPGYNSFFSNVRFNIPTMLSLLYIHFLDAKPFSGKLFIQSIRLFYSCWLYGIYINIWNIWPLLTLGSLSCGNRYIRY